MFHLGEFVTIFQKRNNIQQSHLEHRDRWMNFLILRHRFDSSGELVQQYLQISIAQMHSLQANDH